MSESYGFTALTTFGGILATKKFKADPLTGGIATEPYGKAKHFGIREVDFTGIDDFHGKLQLLLGDKHRFIVRGHPLPGTDLSRALRRLGPEPDEPATFGPCPRAWAMLDIDWQPAPEGIDPVADPEGALAFLLEKLPPELADVDVVVTWGSSQGIKPGKFSAHVFFLLEGPVPDADLRRWAEAQRARLPLDPAVFNPIQAHYTAAPVLVGLKDPLADRRIVLVTRGKRTATLDIPELPPPPAPGDRPVGGRTSRGYEAHRARIGTEDGFHGPILSAVGAFVAEHGPIGTDVDALIPDLQTAIRQADPGGRGPEEIDRYASDKFLRDLIRSTLRKEAAPTSDTTAATGTGPYDKRHGCYTFTKTLANSTPDTSVLTNFTAEIVEDLTVDDGAETHKFFGIEGTLCDGKRLPRIQVPAAQFMTMNWPPAHWGSDVVIFSGRDGKDRTRDAIQRFSIASGAKQCRTVFQHCGWRKINGEWFYLHAGGGIGAGGSRTDVHVELQGGLANLSLPDPPDDVGDLFAGILAALPGPDRIKLVLLAAVARAVLAEIAALVFSLFLLGATGRFKTEVAALYQKFFGSGFSPQLLPGNFASTANALERGAFTAKDCFYTVDEFTPKGVGTREAAELHAKAERLFRSVGNHAARNRLNQDTSARAGYVPRGFVVATGEDLPRGQSLLARLLSIEFDEGDITPADLTRAQHASGDFAELTSAFVKWLAPRIDELKKTAPARLEELRGKATAKGMHARTPDLVASLYYGMDTLATFLVESKALSVTLASDLLRKTWDALVLVAAAQSDHLRASDPITRLDALLSAIFSSGRGNLLDSRTGDKPENAVSWGWKKEVDPLGRVLWHRPGAALGYLSEEGEMLLDWEATYAVLQKLATEQGESLSLSSRSLLKLLDDRHRIVREPGSPTRTVRFTPPGGGDRGRYLHLRPQFLAGGGTPRERVQHVQHVPEAPQGPPVTAPLAVVSGSRDTLDMLDTFAGGGRGSGNFDADEEVVA